MGLFLFAVILMLSVKQKSCGYQYFWVDLTWKQTNIVPLQWPTLHYPVDMSKFRGRYRPAVSGFSFRFISVVNQLFDVLITFNYDIKKLIVMPKLESKTVGLMPTTV